MADSLHIAFAAPEMVPYIKTGGLADVCAALPKALGRLGHRVTVFVPRYGPIGFPPGELVGSVHVPVDAVPRSAGFYRREHAPGVEVVFVEHPPFFDRPTPYGENNRDYPDNGLRFAFFARACLEYFRGRGERPDVFHAHDWQTGLLPVYLKAFYWDDPVLRRTPTVMTIHNLAYQGNFGLDVLGMLGLPPHLGTTEAIEFHGWASYLKGGIVFAEMVTTVSPTYAREIQTPEHGHSMDGVLRSRGDDLVGILNGVDYEEWDPARGSAHREEVLRGRARGEDGLQGGSAADIRAAGRAGDPGRRGDLAARLRKGARSGRGRGRGAAPPPAEADRAGDGGAGDPGRIRGTRRPGTRPRGGAVRVQHRARAQDRGGCGHLPDAFARGAMRAHADVQPALRDRADRARDRADWSIPSRTSIARAGRGPGSGSGRRIPWECSRAWIGRSGCGPTERHGGG